MSSRVESGFVPLPKVEQEQPEDKIRMFLNLPSYVDQDRIGVNLTGISKLCRLGGIHELIVIGETDLETSHVIPEVAGLNSDGSALASKKIVKVTVPTFEANTYNATWENRRIADRWIRLNINMNVDEIGTRIAEERGGVHAVKNWTKELNKGLQTPIRTSGNKNLLHDLEINDKIDSGNILAVTGLFSIMAFLTNGDPNPTIIVGATAGNRLVSLILALKDPDHRFSLFPGFQVDRAIVLGIASRTSTLIKDLHTDKQ